MDESHTSSQPEDIFFQEEVVNHLRNGDWAQALRFATHWIEHNPMSVEAHGNRSYALRQLALFPEALECLDHVIHLKPDSFIAYQNRGVVLRDMKCLEEALMSHERALEIKPDYVQAWKNKGIVLSDLGRFQEALRCYKQVLELLPHDAQAYSLCGHVFHRLGRFEEAIESYNCALHIRPNYAEVLYDRSLSLRELLRLEEAIESCEQAVRIRPHFAEAWWNQAEMLILLGDYERGWPMFHWRWRSGEYGKVMRHLEPPLWLGEDDLVGKSILIHRDGGFGDTLNFCRYTSMLLARGAEVILEVQKGLVDLLETSFPEVQVIGNGEALPAFDWHCPLMNLPGALGLSLRQVPETGPYLHVPEAHLHRWKSRLGSSSKPRIGLVWSGSSDHSNDRQRSMPLSHLTPLFAYSETLEFHCLQKLIRDRDRDLAEELSLRLWEEELSDFAETAALVMEMDLVITVDTSMAHLAGALGKSVWVMLPHVPDMRWLLHREDSPWYPEVMRLFRQPERGDWLSVIKRISEELNAFEPSSAGRSARRATEKGANV